MKYWFSKLFICLGLIITITENCFSQSLFIDTNNFDKTVLPGDNFFQYVNGVWLKKPDFPTKDWKGDWGGFIKADYYSQQKLATLLEKLSKHSYLKGTPEQKISDFFKSYMDTAAINKVSFDPLKPLLNKIDKVKNVSDLIIVIGELAKENGEKLLGFSVWPDEKNSKINIVRFSQAGNTFSNHENYTRTDPAGIKNRNALLEVASLYFRLLGMNDTTAIINANHVLSLEKKLVASWRKGNSLSNPLLNYNKLSISEAQKSATNLNWPLLLKTMGVKTDSVNIAQPDYFRTLSNLLDTEPIEAWKAKLKFDYLYKNAWDLSRDFSFGKNTFRDKISGGNASGSSRLEGAAYTIMTLLKDVVSQLYVKEYMSPASKTKVEEMAKNIHEVLAERITRLTWMSDTTKKYALLKLKSMIKNIGYPGVWVSFSDVSISWASYFSNVRSIAMHNYKLALSNINKPINRNAWVATPSPIHVGASYMSTHHSITLPAGIMQLPYFDLNADDAINYGGIGTAIAHEMTHAFDNLGRKYDAEGNLKNWWQQDDEQKFSLKTSMMVSQYSKYIVYDSLHFNSELTLNENIADLGAVSIAYEAFKKTKQGQTVSLTDGLTPAQRFFISYALKYRVYSVAGPNIKSTLNTSLHAPNQIRVNAPLSNFQPFYDAFGLTEKNKMFRSFEDRIVIW